MKNYNTRIIVIFESLLNIQMLEITNNKIFSVRFDKYLNYTLITGNSTGAEQCN